MQQQAVLANAAPWAHWGPDPAKYSTWKTHSNRLIPLYVFGDSLDRVRGSEAVYRDATKIEKLYGVLPKATHNPQADYLDQTDVYRLQKSAAEAGKKRIILFVFDGTDWQTTWAAAIAKSKRVAYTEGRGTGLNFQDYRGAPTDYGYFVTSPHNEGTSVNVDDQRVTTVGGKIPGGFDPNRAGQFPWSNATDAKYLIATGDEPLHAYTDSASSATSLTCGIKTYNDAINVDFSGREAVSIARTLQEQGYAVGVVTSVPISHATPAAAYASNVHRDDYQDLTRDLIGVPSVYHPGGLPGVDVLIGCGWGEEKQADGAQGKNFVPGNRYLAAADLQKIDAAQGGKYVIAQRTAGQLGTAILRQGVEAAVQRKQRLFGYFGVKGGHLPFQTADGGYDPVSGVGNGGKPDQAEVYTAADVRENPKLADMTIAAVDVLQARSDRWWLMVEAGDVDWANHSNNLDNSIGALHAGDDAFAAVTQWIETHGGWADTAVYLTADHGHYLVIDDPQAIATAAGGQVK
ncbi:MAG: alkaline phosphatase [Pirellulaceae bacterium]|nr:alkaline phosphatase [Pirellulaceae bacterium]